MNDTAPRPGHNHLEVLAAEIRQAHQDSADSALAAAQRALDAGHALIEAKRIVPHGGWADWLKEHVGFSERSARRYMQLASSDIKPATVAEMGLRAAVEQIAARKAEEARLLAHMQQVRLEQERRAREKLDQDLEDAEELEHKRIMAAYRAEPWIDAAEIIARADPALPRYDFHPDNVFPLMKLSDFAALVRSIREHGQFEPIHLFEGKILDGRLRYLACLEAGVQPRFVAYEGDDYKDFLISQNILRKSIPTCDVMYLRVLEDLHRQGVPKHELAALISDGVASPALERRLPLGWKTYRFGLSGAVPRRLYKSAALIGPDDDKDDED